MSVLKIELTTYQYRKMMFALELATDEYKNMGLCGAAVKLKKLRADIRKQTEDQ